MCKWSEFYLARINSSYQDYFEGKYAPLINKIVDLNPRVVKEEGIGIGSLTKALKKRLPYTRFIGSDISSQILDLCRKNVGGVELRLEDINDRHIHYDNVDVVVTHGVLEHFEDDAIRSILEKYERANVAHCHYVPTNYYETPSFGDERLLCWTHWVRIKPPTLLTYKDGDLFLYYKKRINN